MSRGIVLVGIVSVTCQVRNLKITNEKEKEQTKDEADLTPQAHEIELKGAYNSFVIAGVPKGNIGSYVDQVNPRIKALIEDQLKEIHSEKIVITLWVRWNKTLKT